MAKRFSDLPPLLQGLILGLLAVGIAAAVFWFYVLPLSERRDNLDREVKRLKAENDRNEAYRREQTEYLNRIAQLERQLETLRSIVPDEQDTDAFMRSVYEAGVATGANIRTFVAQPLVVRDFYTEMPFNMRIDGTYFSLLNFFDRLSREQRIVSVTGLSLGTPTGGGLGAYTIHPSETVGANFVITTYFNNPQPVAAAPPPPPRR